jgi:hypothetical protein
MSLHLTGRLATLVAVAALTAACSGVPAASVVAPRGDVGATPATGPHSTTTSTSATAPPTAEAEVTTSVTEVVAIPFGSTSVDDQALLKGAKVIRASGRVGQKTVTWLVRTRGGVEVGRTMSGEHITAPPVDEAVAVGTVVPAPTPTTTPASRTTPPTQKPAPTPSPTKPAASGKCDPNYTGACVPIASDVDCSSGSGDGPAYVVGPVRVIGRDIYKLDGNGDGIGCENG